MYRFRFGLITTSGRTVFTAFSIAIFTTSVLLILYTLSVFSLSTNAIMKISYSVRSGRNDLRWFIFFFYFT